MNTRETLLPIPDVQNTPDTRQIDIDRVGIKGIRHPVRVSDRTGGVQHTVANFNMYVQLPRDFKGTHMSRFVEILNRNERQISVESFGSMLEEMTQRLEAKAGHIEMNFPYFMNKAAPVSGVTSLIDYDITFIGEIENGRHTFTVKVQVPVTSLCPCSKEISAYGAHNQRSHVTVTAKVNAFIWVEEIVRICEESPRANSTACSSARTKSTSPNAPTTTQSSSKTWCATSPTASITNRASRAMWSSRRISSRSTTTRPTP